MLVERREQTVGLTIRVVILNLGVGVLDQAIGLVGPGNASSVQFIFSRTRHFPPPDGLRFAKAFQNMGRNVGTVNSPPINA